MSVTAPFIRRPVATTLMMAAILIFGIMGYRLLPISDLPNIDFPTISVSASLAGASPETMASAVATPLERQFTTISGLDSITSSNRQGSTQITLQFSLDRDIDAAAQDVQSAISQSLGRLPNDMPSPPTIRKVNPADSPVLYLALNSETMPLAQVTEYANTFFSPRISTIEGVAQVNVYGSAKYAVRIRLDPQKLASRGIGVDEVASAIRAANVDLPTGTLSGPQNSFTLEAKGQLERAADFEQLIIAYRNGAPIRLVDVGVVFDDVEDNKAAAWFNDKRGVILAIQRQPGTNTIEVINRINGILPSVRELMPPSLNIELLYDRSISIRESVNDVKFTLMLTAALVVLVIFIFLRSVRATIIPSLALPLSILGTFAVMYVLNFSLNNLSLIALTLAVGLVIDDAIVMLENIVRHIEMGEAPMEAALKGANEIGFTIVSMTVSLLAVFIPILFMGGIVGRLFHEFAVTIATAILMSAVVSLTLTPMLCSLFLRAHSDKRHSRIFNFFEHIFDGLLAAYRRTLQVSLRFHPITFLIFLATIGFSIFFFLKLPKGFLPSEDLGQLVGQTEAAQGISFDSMVEHQQAAARVIAADPNIAAFMSSIGSGSSAQSNAGRFFIRLTDHADRKLTADEIIARLRPKLAEIPGIKVFLQNRPSITIGGRLSKAQYQYTLQSADADLLYESAPKLEDKLHDIPGLQDVTSDLQVNNPQIVVDIDRDKASTLGVTMQQVEDALYSSYGSRRVSTINAATDQYDVQMELLPEFQVDEEALSQLYVRAQSGTLVPLATLAHITSTVGPLSVNHQGQLPSVTLSFNLSPGVALSDAVRAVEQAAKETLPGTITASFQGTAQAFASSVQGLGLLLLFAVVVIYIVLGILYESFIHPITILSGLPSAGLGALAALLLFDKQLDLYAFVGIILLIGIVKKNAIMMIDFALEAQRNEGLTPREAIFEGCLIRFRPIMMTTMAALMGTLPIAIGFGTTGASRQSLGIAVVGGLVVSQLLTLYITPVFFLYMEQLSRFLNRVWWGSDSGISGVEVSHIESEESVTADSL